MDPSTGLVTDPLSETLKAYFASQRISEPSRADTIVGLLRINTRESLRAAEELMGRAITRCPAALPVWPPKPVQHAASRASVVHVGDNPCLPTTNAFQRFCLVKKGMTKEQLAKRGITKRDIRLWSRSGAIQIG